MRMRTSMFFTVVWNDCARGSHVVSLCCRHVGLGRENTMYWKSRIWVAILSGSVIVLEGDWGVQAVQCNVFDVIYKM